MSDPVRPRPEASEAIRWTAEQEVEAVKQQLPNGAWKQGASLARCVEDLRMDRDALCQQLAEAEAILKNPQKWMQWCDHKMLERCEAAEAERERLKVESDANVKHNRHLQQQLEHRTLVLGAKEKQLEVLTTALSALVEKWSKYCDHENIYAACSDELAALLAAHP